MLPESVIVAKERVHYHLPRPSVQYSFRRRETRFPAFESLTISMNEVVRGWVGKLLIGYEKR